MVKLGTKKKRSKQQLEEVRTEEVELKQVSYHTLQAKNIFIYRTNMLFSLKSND